jgi:probable DNA metabolism protein
MTFDDWRATARAYLTADVPPADVHFGGGLFGAATPPAGGPRAHTVSKAFLDLAEAVACHRDPGRWDLLYRGLWRLTHGEPHLLDLASDDDVARLMTMEKAVRRDAHKLKAFVRFRRVEAADGEHFIAWHRPDHRTVRRTAPFFARRFPEMRWSILTPDESVSWDLDELQFGPGVPASEAPGADRLESLWKTYYGATFNPARIKLKAMKKELPVRHWPTLPEAALIPQLLAEAPKRVERMVARSEGFAGTARDYIPPGADLAGLREAAKGCRACGLCEAATRTVFGEGPADARIVLVGEQPGDQEDLAGRPFVGPAGDVLNEALAEAGLDRGELYLTNAVKHFKFEGRGPRRLHKKATTRETIVCRPWLVAELEALQPEVVVCLRATAAQSVIGRDFQVTERRGEIVRTDLCERTVATYHPAAILRMPDADRSAAMRAALVTDLRTALRMRVCSPEGASENSQGWSEAKPPDPTIFGRPLGATGSGVSGP